MKPISRREFLQASSRLAAMMALGSQATLRIAQAVEDLAAGRAPVLWLQGQTCAGCSISLLNSDRPAAAQVVTQLISLKFHATLSAATGEIALAAIADSIAKGGYILAVEGAIPQAMPKACCLGGQDLNQVLLRAARGAKAVLAVGTCASFGGVPAAKTNLTGATGVGDFLKASKVTTPLVALPGCPAHPDWTVGTLAHLLKFGLPKLDDSCRPRMFYDRPVHDRCQRFADYQGERFASTFGDDGCMFKLGCLGPDTNADCPLRLWNSGVNSCIQAGMPCIGCATPDFARDAELTLYRKTQPHPAPPGEAP